MITDDKFEFVPEFHTDFQKLCKKYVHLEDDFERLQKALEIDPINGARRTVRISKLGHNVVVPVYKVKHFRSQDFRGHGSKSGFRIIYTYIAEDQKIIFIEFYHKTKQTNHDIKRIKKYFESY